MTTRYVFIAGLITLICAVACAPPERPKISTTAVSASELKANDLEPSASKTTSPKIEFAVERPGQARLIETSRTTSSNTPLSNGDYGNYPAAHRLIDRLVADAGFNHEALAGVLARIERQQWILDYMNRPQSPKRTGPTGSWTRYRAKFITSDNIANGLAFWRRHADTLRQAERKWGVPAQYVVAILGVETRYGGYLGSHRIIDALATLAFDYPRRAEFFTDELAHFLIMTRDEGIDPFEPVGSYAGAMGLAQFMPSSFRRYAVDFDGDGQRDLWHPTDAIGSVANYFSGHGWRPGDPVTIRAQALSTAAETAESGFDTRYDQAALARIGVRGERPFNGEVSLIRLDAAGNYEYWLGFNNFYVITRYNHSSYYAMAVHQLAEALVRNGAPGRRVAALR